MPIMRITRGTLRPGAWDRFEAAYREAVKEVGQIPGLISRSLAHDLSDSDQGYTISVWESLEALEGYEGSELKRTVTPMLQAFFTGDYRSEHCEVRYSD
jgi:heme-degrading monooxygenase HmoA